LYKTSRSVEDKAVSADVYYYSGQKDVQEKAIRAELAACDDLDRTLILRARLAMLLRGQKKWGAAGRELRLDGTDLSRASADSKAFVYAAQGALLLEQGSPAPAADYLEPVLRHFSRCTEYTQLRQYVSSAWKYAELEGSFGRVGSALSLLSRATSVAQEIGDLHGYCNSRIAEAHISISQGNFKNAITALIWASHPPAIIGNHQPRPRFIAGELARAWAIVEWKYRLTGGKWLGYVHPLWALKFASQRLNESMSFVMRVPFLAEFAIASPNEVYNIILEHEGMLPLGKGSRAKFSRTERERISSLYEGMCALCGCQINESEKWHVDHIVLHSIGHAPKRTARDAYLNYRPVHSRCNLVRGDSDFWYLNTAYHNNPTL
jgi:hypothetical protein